LVWVTSAEQILRQLHRQRFNETVLKGVKIPPEFKPPERRRGAAIPPPLAAVLPTTVELLHRALRQAVLWGLMFRNPTER
jgi:hypothetical protein